MRRSVLIAAIVAALAASAGAQAVDQQQPQQAAVPADAAASAVAAAVPADMAAPASGPAEEAAASMEGAAGEKDAVAGAQAAVAGAPEGVVVSDEAAAAGADAQAAADDAAAAGAEAAQAAADGSSTASLPSVAQAANALPGFTVQSLAALQSAAAAVPKPATAEVAALGQSFADKVTGAFNTFNYSSVPWNSIAHKVNTQADKAAKQVYAKIENKLPAVNETALEAKLHAPVEKLNATVTKVKAKVAGAIEWEAPTKLNATINNPKFKDAVNKTFFHPFWSKPEFKALVQDSPVKVTWATPAEIEAKAAEAKAAGTGAGETNMFNQASWQANDVEALPSGAAAAAKAGASTPQTIVLSKTLDDVRALVARISAGQGPTQAEVTRAVEVATPAVSEFAAQAAPAFEAAAGKVTAYLQESAPEVASLVAPPAGKPGAAPAPMDVSAVAASMKSFAQKVGPSAVAAVGAANPAAGAQLAALAKTAGVDVSKEAQTLKMDDIAQAIDAVGSKVNATFQDPAFIDKVQGALGKLNSTLEGKWNKVLAAGPPKAAKAPKVKLPDPTPALDAILPPSFKAIVTPPSRRSPDEQVVYDDTLGAVVKLSEQPALRAEFEANRAAAAEQERAAENYRRQADAEIAATNKELAAQAAKESAAKAAKAADAAVPEGKGTAAVAGAADAAAPPKAPAAAAAPAAAPAQKKAPAAAAPAAAPAKGAVVPQEVGDAASAAMASFKQAPARNATLNPKLEALATEAGELQKELAAKANATGLAALADEALAKVNAGLDGAFKAGRKAAPDLSGLRDKIGEVDGKVDEIKGAAKGAAQ